MIAVRSGAALKKQDPPVLRNIIDNIDDMTRKVYVQAIIGPLMNSGYDDELVTTLKQYLANNMNMSQAAKCLFIHRNTLLYRLSKIHSLTGLNPRRFDHAFHLRVALALWEEGKVDSNQFSLNQANNAG